MPFELESGFLECRVEREEVRRKPEAVETKVHDQDRFWTRLVGLLQQNGVTQMFRVTCHVGPNLLLT